MDKAVIKLKNKNGASLALALLFFLVCLVVGTVVLTAASAAMGRVTTADAGSRTRYALSSAAEVIADKMHQTELLPEGVNTFNAHDAVTGNTEIKYTFNKTVSSYSEAEKTAVTAPVYDPVRTAVDLTSLQQSMADGIIKALWSDFVLASWRDNSHSKWAVPSSMNDKLTGCTDEYFLMSVSDQNGDGKNEIPVWVWMEMDRNLNIKITLFECSDQTQVTAAQFNADLSKAAQKYYVSIPASGSVSYDADRWLTDSYRDRHTTDANGQNITVSEYYATNVSMTKSVTIQVSWGDAVISANQH